MCSQAVVFCHKQAQQASLALLRLLQITWHLLAFHISGDKRCKPPVLFQGSVEQSRYTISDPSDDFEWDGSHLPFLPFQLLHKTLVWSKPSHWAGGGHLTPTSCFTSALMACLSCSRACWASSSSSCQSLWLQCDFLWPIPLGWHGACSGTAAGEHFAGPAVPQWLCYPALQLEWTQSSSY